MTGSEKVAKHFAAMSRLQAEGIVFKTANGGAHLQVWARFDFWPGTGRWKERGMGRRAGRGVESLIEQIRADRASRRPERQQAATPHPAVHQNLCVGCRAPVPGHGKVACKVCLSRVIGSHAVPAATTARP